MYQPLQVGESIEINGFRLNRYGFGIQAVDLTNAGKRGKLVDVWDFTSYANNHTERTREADLYASEVEQLVRAHTPTVAEIDAAAWRCGCKVQRYTRKGIEIATAGWSAVAVRGEHVAIEVEWDSFRLCDLKDPNLSTAIPRSGDKRSVQRMRAWARQSVGLLQPLTFWEAVRAMREAGIECHTYCAMD